MHNLQERRPRGPGWERDPSRRVSCECKEDERVIVEPDGYEWTTPTDGPCRGCELARMLPGLRPCPIHQPAGSESADPTGPKGIFLARFRQAGVLPAHPIRDEPE